MAASGVDDKVLLHMDAIIGSMTPKERARPELLNAKRKIRVAKGSRHRRCRTSTSSSRCTRKWAAR